MELEVGEDLTMCRVCLVKEEDSECLYDEWHDAQLSEAGKLYEELIGVKIGVATKGPQYLCNSCGLQMRLFKKLKTKAYKTLESLQQKYCGEEVALQRQATAAAIAVTMAVVVEEKAALSLSLPPTLLDNNKMQMKLEIPDDAEEAELDEDSDELLQQEQQSGNSYNLAIIQKSELGAVQTSLTPPVEFAIEEKFTHMFHEVPPTLDQLTPHLSSSNEMALRKELDAVLDKKINTAEHGYATIVYELLKDVNVEELEEEEPPHGAATVVTLPPPAAPAAAAATANFIETVAVGQEAELEAEESLLHEEETTDDKSLYFDVHYLDETYEDGEEAEMYVEAHEAAAAAAAFTTRARLKSHEDGENQRPAMLRRKVTGRREVLTSGSGCEKKYHCSFCQWAFSTRKALTEHKKSDHPTKYPCSLCKKVMHSAETLRVHMNVHSGAAAYSCELCHKTFKQKVHYKYHIDKHNNVRNFKCDVPSCGKAFITNTDLKTHKRFHSNERPYACDLCDKDFMLLQHLKMHRYSHGKKSLRCDICEQIFISPNTLRFHIKSIHNEEPRFQCEFCKKKFRRKHHLHSHYKQHEKANIQISTLDANNMPATRFKEEALDIDDEEYVDDPLQEFIECNTTEIECISVYDVEDEETATAAGGEHVEAVEDDGGGKVLMHSYADIIEEHGDLDAAAVGALLV